MTTRTLTAHARSAVLVTAVLASACADDDAPCQGEGCPPPVVTNESFGPASIVHLTPSLEHARAGEPFVIGWHTAHARHCELSSSPPAATLPRAVPVSGSTHVAIDESTRFTLACVGATGSDPVAVHAEVSVGPRVDGFRVKPSLVTAGQRVTVAFDTPADAACTLEANGRDPVAVRSGASFVAEQSGELVLTCADFSGTVTRRTQLVVANVALEVEPSPVEVGAPAVVRYRSSDPLSCSAAARTNGATVAVVQGGATGSVSVASVQGPLDVTVRCQLAAGAFGGAVSVDAIVLERHVASKPSIGDVDVSVRDGALVVDALVAGAQSCALVDAGGRAQFPGAGPFVLAERTGMVDLTLACTSPDGIEAVAPVGRVFFGDLTVARSAELIDVRAVTGALSFAGARDDTLVADALEAVGGGVVVSDTLAVSLALPALQRIGGALRIEDNAHLDRVDLSTVDAVGGSVAIARNQSLGCAEIAELACGLGRATVGGDARIVPAPHLVCSWSPDKC